MDRIVKVGEQYRHFKGNSYEVIAIATNADNREEVVVYKALYGNGRVFVRNYQEFISEVDHRKYPDVKQQYRFELISSANAIENEPEEDIEGEAVDPRLMAFLETRHFEEKLQIVRQFGNEITDSIIDAMAASMDISIGEGDIESRLRELKNCISTFNKFDCSDRFNRK